MRRRKAQSSSVGSRQNRAVSQPGRTIPPRDESQGVRRWRSTTPTEWIIEVQQDTEISQPGALSGGDTVVTRDSRIVAEEEEGRLTMLEGVTIGQLVGALNSMGVKPRDLIQIMLTIKAAGALQAEIASL